MNELTNQDFQQEVIEMLKPKIKSILNQTDFKHREDLEQEIALMITMTIKEKKFKKFPTFFELLEQEKAQHTRPVNCP